MRELVKAIGRFLAHLVGAPLLLAHALKIPILGKNRALEGSSQLVSLLPGLSGQYIRQAFFSWTIAECHPSATIAFGTILSKTSARIGANAYIGPYCSLGSVTIERDVLIATGVHLLSGGRVHGSSDSSRPIRDQEGKFVHITIGTGSWIGAGAVIMADVGRDSIVGAGAVVSRPIPPSVVAAGVPARVLRTRISDLTSPPTE